MSDITTDFVKATKKIYEKVAAILTHLQIIESHVKLIRDQTVRDSNTKESNPQPDATQQGHPDGTSATDGLKKGKTDREKKGGGGKESSDDESFLQALKRRWKKAIKKPVVQLEIAAIIGLGIYTCETKRTNDLTDKSIKFQFSLARSQERSYLQINFAPFHQAKLEDIKDLFFALGVKNLGKVTASQIKTDVFMELPLAAEAPSFNYGTRHSSGIVPPMAPGGDSFLPAQVAGQGFDPQPMTDALRSDLRSGTKYMVIFGRIEYEDAFGYWWQNFCDWKSHSTQNSGFNASSCVQYNTEGGTPKKFPIEQR